MLTDRKIRVIKRGQPPTTEPNAPDTRAGREPQRAEKEPLRSVKTVVSGWVREHQQRAEEFRNSYSTLLKEVGFSAPSSCARC